MQRNRGKQQNGKDIRDTKGTFHAQMISKKDRNALDLTEAEDIKKRRQEYTEELYKKKIFMTQIITMVWSLLDIKDLKLATYNLFLSKCLRKFISKSE